MHKYLDNKFYSVGMEWSFQWDWGDKGGKRKAFFMKSDVEGSLFQGGKEALLENGKEYVWQSRAGNPMWFEFATY